MKSLVLSIFMMVALQSDTAPELKQDLRGNILQVQRDRLSNALRMAQLAEQYRKAQEDEKQYSSILEGLFKSAEVDGWTLDPDSLTYKKK